MGRILKADDSKPRELIPAGNYLGVACGVYVIGTQDGGQYGPKEQVIVSFELHKKSGPARDAQGRSLLISNFYTVSFNEKANLRKDVETITGHGFRVGEDFDIESILGQSCRLTVAHEEKAGGKKREFIKSFMALDPEDPRPQAEADQQYYECDPSREIPPEVPGWIARFIERSHEFRDVAALRDSDGKPVAAVAATGPVDDDDIPF